MGMFSEAAKKTGHTPGPWKILTLLGNRRVAVCTENSAPLQAGICEMISEAKNVDYEGRLSNAALIAAAPEMLAALKKIAAAQAIGDGPRLAKDQYCLDTASAAIAKAECR